MQYDAQRSLYFLSKCKHQFVAGGHVGQEPEPPHQWRWRRWWVWLLFNISLLLSQSQTFFFSHNPWHFLFLSCSVRFVSRRGPLCLWQHREEAACRGGGQGGELRLEVVVDLYQVARCGVWNPRICLKRDKHRPSPFVHKWTKFPATELTFTWLGPLPLLLSLSVANLNKVLLQLRPTTGRVPIPPECADGTIAVCVTGWVSKKRM